ncbi:hypothetical protein PR003_g32363 [Phytophthora rubi]|uniref:Uncharacterized protein n=1 Tax=Phytophthora rubi TaxID=129364 RepID=A0A6A4AXT6_9STRA|nr:hypothetical protein PR003_g32363 [Phytophthora rubi]
MSLDCPAGAGARAEKGGRRGALGCASVTVRRPWTALPVRALVPRRRTLLCPQGRQCDSGMSLDCPARAGARAEKARTLLCSQGRQCDSEMSLDCPARVGARAEKAYVVVRPGCASVTVR